MGVGSTSGELRLLSRSFYPLPLWANIEAGYRYRSDGFSDEWTYGVMAGTSPFKVLTVVISVYGVNSLNNGTRPNRYADLSITQATMVLNDQEYHRLTAGMMWHLTDVLALEAAYDYFLAGKRIVAGQSIVVGLSIRN